MERAVIYARFSSDRQTEASIEAQVRACREYAARNNMTVGEVYADEAISGKGSKTAKRLQYQRMLQDAKRGAFDTILIHKYDRIARNVGEHVNLTLRLDEIGVKLVAVAQDFGDSREGKIMRTMMWALTEYYIDNLGSEVTKGLVEKAYKAEHTGGKPAFGYDVIDGKYAVNELEAQYVRRMFQCAINGTGYTALLAEMNAAGVRGKRGAEMKYTQVYEILRNERYTGVYLYSPSEEKNRADRRTKPHAIRIEGGIPAIVSKETFEKVQEIMNGRKQTGTKANYLCSRLVYCGKCGAKMHANHSTRKGHIYERYVCTAHCGMPTVLVEQVDEAAKTYLHTLLTDEVQAEIEKALRQYIHTEKDTAKAHKEIVKRKVAEKQRQIDALYANLAAGVLSSEVLAGIDKQIVALRQQIEALEAAEPPHDFTTDEIITWLRSIREAPDATAIRLLIERIDVTRDKEKDTTEFNITSTLNSVVSKNGCGGRT